MNPEIRLPPPFPAQPRNRGPGDIGARECRGSGGGARGSGHGASEFDTTAAVLGSGPAAAVAEGAAQAAPSPALLLRGGTSSRGTPRDFCSFPFPAAFSLALGQVASHTSGGPVGYRAGPEARLAGSAEAQG